ncbi:hypothetical protein TNCV_2058671 [Trichonephila clavipes]|nr:hypothetical protein TNCV_2058671 [Trichonephila clavipes]
MIAKSHPKTVGTRTAIKKAKKVKSMILKVNPMIQRRKRNVFRNCSLVVKVMDSWSACHEFEPCAAEDPPYRGGRCTLNISRLKCPLVGVEVKRRGAGSDVVHAT